MHWFEYRGNESDVFLSTRVRLARNIVDYPFGDKLGDVGGKEIAQRVKGALEGGGYTFEEFSALAENERTALVEKNLASPEMLRCKPYSAIAENREKGISVLVCEEDHIRIQAIRSGLDIKGAMAAAFEAEELIDAKEKFAFSKELGYLTHCPTNLGTGMRVSVMMFLPMLTISGKLRTLEGALQKIGLTVRGVRGEGSESLGSLYQISNRVTLGIDEEEIGRNLLEAVESLASEERKMRNDEKENVALEDRIMRSYGIMKYAKRIDTEEMYKLYSDVRLGICMGYIKGDEHEADRLIIECLPANLSLLAGRELSYSERDILRAERLKKA